MTPPTTPPRLRFLGEYDLGESLRILTLRALRYRRAGTTDKDAELRIKAIRRAFERDQ